MEPRLNDPSGEEEIVEEDFDYGHPAADIGALYANEPYHGDSNHSGDSLASSSSSLKLRDQYGRLQTEETEGEIGTWAALSYSKRPIQVVTRVRPLLERVRLSHCLSLVSWRVNIIFSLV